MHNHPQALAGDEPDRTDREPARAGRVVDVANRDSVLDFTAHYLESLSRERTIDAVHDVTAAIARYKGPRLVRWASLEAFLAGLER